MGWLALNPTLDRVAIVRQTKPVEIAIDKDLDITEYECLLGVPYGYKHLIGKELYFISYNNGVLGPWLVVDVESSNHAGYMKTNNLVADINCEEYVHEKGVLIYADVLER